MIDTAAIKARFEAVAPFLGERELRLIAASEARAAGRGGVTAVCSATGIARSTIGRGLAELRAAVDKHPGRSRAVGDPRRPRGRPSLGQ